MTTALAARPRQKDWTNIIFLMLTPILGIPVTAWYTWKTGFSFWMLALCVGMFTVIGLSICAGYHRLFSHKSYECSPRVQALYAFFGAMAAQNSILCWSSDHRNHHQYVDKDWDPYNIQRGFWWAHFFWVFYKPATPKTFANVPDLEKNPVVAWQHRWYKWILMFGIFVIPTGIGALFGRPLAGLLWGGFLRVVITHHTTFLVNSMAHYLGKRTFNARVSARDNWVLALVTFGEGVPQLSPPLSRRLPKRRPLVPLGSRQVVDPRPEKRRSRFGPAFDLGADDRRRASPRGGQARRAASRRGPVHPRRRKFAGASPRRGRRSNTRSRSGASTWPSGRAASIGAPPGSVPDCSSGSAPAVAFGAGAARPAPGRIRIAGAGRN